MKRKILSLILCCALLFSLAACGKTEAPQPTASAGTETAPNSENPAAAEGISYADAYAQYTAIYGALLNAVQQRLDTHDARLQAAYPDSYYMNSDYLLLVYVPFTTAYPSLGRELRADNLDAAQTSLRETFPDAVLTMTAPGRFEAVYTYVDKTSGTEVQREGKCQWDCDGLTGAIRVRAYIDGELTEFTPRRQPVPALHRDRQGDRRVHRGRDHRALARPPHQRAGTGPVPRRHAAYESCRAGLLPR